MSNKVKVIDFKHRDEQIYLILAVLFISLAAFSQTVTAQQLKPTEIIYSRLPTNLNAAPTGANSPTIWAVGQGGANDRQIAVGMEPRISDDGRYLLFRRIVAAAGDVFHYNPYAAQAQGNLWVRDLANNSEMMIFDFSSNGRRLFGYYFSPESNQGNYQIILDYGTLFYQMNLDGTGAVALDPYFGGGVPRENDTFPVLRRGDDLIVANNRDRSNFGLMTRTPGSAPPFDMPNTTGNDWNPSWSNDNQFVGFTTLRVNGCLNFDSSASGCNYPYFFNKLNKIKPDGSNRALLTDLSGSNTNGIAFGTIWTNDNSKIIAAARIGGVASLYAFNTNGSGTYAQIPISGGNAPDFVGGIVQPRDEQQLISSGGGLITDGNQFSMLTSIGEPILGDASGGNYNFSGGFLTGLSNAEARFYEADVQSRPNGDGFIDSDDIQQIRRFAVGLDLPYQNNEFQRADDSPRNTLGDSYVDADDVEQARRYSVGLDYTDSLANGQTNLPAAGGPPNPIESQEKSAEEIAGLLQTATFAPESPSAGRAVRVVNQVVAGGGSVTVPINVDTAGDETGYTFSVAFDKTKMTATSVTIGNLGGNVISNINNTLGTIGFSVASFAGPNGTIPEATNQTLLKINFTTVASLVGGMTNLVFTDLPARRKVSGTDPGNPLPQPVYTNGTTTIGGSNGANVGYAGWWAGDGDPRDISAIGNNAALAPAPNAPGFAIGKVGQAFNFTAEGQYVSIPDSPSVRPQSFTIEGWAKLTNPQSPYPTFFGKGVGTGSNDSYAVWYDGNLNAAVCDLNGCAQIAAPFTQNVWHHIAFAFNDPGAGMTKTLTLYLDGAAVANGTTSGTPAYDTHPALIGADYDNEIIKYSWHGAIDEVSFFNRVLTTSEIQSIYNAGINGKIKQSATNAGANSQTKVGDATINFANVTTAGTTVDFTIDPAAQPAIPAGYTHSGLAYQISTTAVYQSGTGGDVRICFNVPALPSTNFMSYRVLHLEGGNWIDRTDLTSAFPNLCTGGLTSLSPFAIVLSAPSAANISIGGRVTDGTRGIARARVTITDANGAERITTTSSFGYYHFDEVMTGETYIVSITSKRYRFAPQVVSVSEDLTDLDFTALPQ